MLFHFWPLSKTVDFFKRPTPSKNFFIETSAAPPLLLRRWRIAMTGDGRG